MQQKFAYIQNEQIVEFRYYDENVARDPVALRPVVVVAVVVPAWQVVASISHVIHPDHVDEISNLVDRALEDVKRERFIALEQEFDYQKAKGFFFNNDTFPLNLNADKAHDLIRRGKGPASPQVLNAKGQLVPLAAQDKNAWLTAGDDRFAALIQVHDQHVAGITATTTPEAAATYDVGANWPALPNDPPPEVL